MKKVILPLFLLVCCGLFSQQVVWDVASMEVLIANHKVQHTSFGQMKQEEAQISALQKSIAEKMTQIEYFQSKFYNSLKSIEAITKTGKDLIYAGDIVEDIVKYQNQMLGYASKDPTLLIVAVKTESQLVQRTADLMQYIYQVAVVGTDVNLMDNKQRLNLLNHVIKELRTMRGLAFAVTRQMRTAMRNGVLKTLFPGQFKYTDNRGKLVKQILDDYTINPKKK
jgi:hypothetical protein